MQNYRMTKDEIERAMQLVTHIRDKLVELSGDDPKIKFAMRRRIYTRLIYDERSTPAKRAKLKKLKWEAQNKKCALCNSEIPLKFSELDRTTASAGYTDKNTKLVCHKCHVDDQRKKKFNDI